MSKEPKVYCPECKHEVVEYDQYNRPMCNICNWRKSEPVQYEFVRKGLKCIFYDEAASLKEEDYTAFLGDTIIVGTKEKK